MSDAMPDYRLESQRLRMQIAQLEHNVERDKFSVLEAEGRIIKAEENIAATKRTVLELRKQLKALAETHPASPKAPPGTEEG